ncbi:MAG: glycosyltransferase [Syntrophobacterales bacterium]|jgi:glycosyltransferase involved in cell wall biosynthesis
MNSPKISEEKIRVLRIIARLNIGGPAIHAILLSRHLERLGYQTLLVAGQVGPEEGDMHYLAEEEGVEPVIIPRLGRRLQPLSDLVALLRILGLLFNRRPHIVHTHTAKAGAVGRMAAAVYNKAQGARHKAQGLVRRTWRRQGSQGQKEFIKNGKCKVVHTFHGHVLHGYFSRFKSKFFQVIEKILAQFTDAIVVVSEQQKEELCWKFGVGRPDQYRVVPLGLNLVSLEKANESTGKLKSDLGLSENGESLVGIVGRLTPIKNHSLFLESVSALMKKNSDSRTRFLIVGDGELRKELEEMTRELELMDQVIFTGWIKDLTWFYADLDVLALTSNNEGTPVAVIEAMAAGVPVIATDVGGVRELISDRGLRIAELSKGEFEICERGLLVQKGDIKGFSKGLKYLLEHPEEGKEMGNRGQEYALEHHSTERLVSNMDMLYRSFWF